MGKINKVSVNVLCCAFLSILAVADLAASESATSPVLVCDDQINVSLNENCDAVITVGMVLEGESQIPGFDPSHYDIDIEGVASNVISEVGIYTVTITERNPPFAPPLNSCWGHILVEDKLPPRIDPDSCDCPEGNMNPDCVLPLLCDELAEFLDNNINVPQPVVIENCSEITTTFRDIVHDNGNCSETVIERVWIYTDGGGNKVESCPFFYRIIPITLNNNVLEPKENVHLECGVGTDPWDIYEFFAEQYRENNPCDDGSGICDPTHYNYDADHVEAWEKAVHDHAVMFSFPSIHGLPLLNHICNTATTYTDVVIPICSSDPACSENAKIIREWQIYDWCNAILEPMEFKQVIKASDNTPPNLYVKDFQVSVDPWGCEATIYFPDPVHMTDNCSSYVRYEVSPAYAYPGLEILYSPDKGWYAHNVPVGTYQFFYHAYDCCDNVTSAGIYVQVKDGTPPVAITKQDIVITLIPSPGHDTIHGVTKIFAESVDNGSFDGCGPVHLEIRRDSDYCGFSGNTTYNNDGHSYDYEHDPDYGRYVTFCCDDLSENGIDADNDGTVDYAQIKVWLRVWDDGDGDGYFGTYGDNYSEVWSYIRLEDKSRPVISCPYDVTIDCDADENDLYLVGEATAYGSCGEVGTEYVDTFDDMSSCNIGTITRKWFVSNYPDEYCYQFITKAGDHFGPPIISWPSDTVVDCTAAVTDVPTWIAGTCDLLAYSVERDTFYYQEGACFKIINYWTVIDWCVYDPGDQTHTNGVWNDIQVIKIVDHSAPTIDACHDATFYADDKNDLDNDGIICESNSVVLTNSATDNGDCASDWLRWTVQIDLYNDWNGKEGSYDYLFSSSAPVYSPYYLPHTSSGEEVTVALPEGVLGSMANHRVVWKVTDGCGNITTCTSYFMVVDNIPPTPYCVNLSTALMDNGQVEIWACDFDLGAFDNCTEQENLRFTFSDVIPELDPSYSPTLKCASMIFTCDDLISTGGSVITLNIYVWDEKNNYDYCSVFLTLVDNQDSCEDIGSQPTAQIGGTILTEQGSFVENVEVVINSTQPEYPKNIMSDGSGHFMFDKNAMHEDYHLVAQRTDNPLNGVSTLDLVHIQKHILGLEMLDSPYKLIAADVNNDGNISAIDLLELRKLILGVYNEFPTNKSWRLVEESSITDPANPWNYSELRYINDLDNNMRQEDFVGVKIGDVNNSAKSNFKSTDVERKSESVVEINFDNISYQEGEVFETKFYLDQAKSITGIQFTLASNGLELLNASGNGVQISDENYAKLSSDYTTFSVNTQNVENEEFITLQFRAIQSGTLNNNIAITSDVTTAEAYIGSDYQIVPLTLTGRNNSEQEFNLYQNNPNPFNGSTEIDFYLPGDMNATLSIFDVNGRVIWSTNKAFDEGLNKVEITKNDLNVTGILYYRLDADEFSATKKMIILK